MFALHHPTSELAGRRNNFRYLLVRLPVTICLLLHVAQLSSTTQDSKSFVHYLAKQFWQWKLREFPERATEDGYHEYDDILETYTMENYEYRYRNCSLLLEHARRIHRDGLSTEDDVTLSVLVDQLETFTNGYQWRNYGNLNPISFMEGIHKSFTWVDEANYLTLDDFGKYIRRLNALPIQIDQIIVLMRRAIEFGTTNHNVSMVEVPNQLDALINSPVGDSRYYKPFLTPQNGSELNSTERAIVEAEGKQAIVNAIQPAYRRLKTFIIQEYMPNTRAGYGVSSLPNGSEYYRAALKWHLSEDMDPGTVHQMGKEGIQRITADMIKLLDGLHFDGSLTDFVAMLNNTASFFNHTGDELLDEYRHIIYERITPKLPEVLFNTSLIHPPKVQASPGDGPIVVYWKDVVYVNTHRPHTRASYKIMSNSLHEALPGHHYQVTLAKKLPFPSFMRYIWPRKYSAPFHFPYYTAYVEGWGMYAEYLGEDLELYKDSYELFGRYTNEIFRSCRLVVDTGIHYYNWSRSDAISYMCNHTFMDEAEVAKEIDRYITWPGQSCAYTIGERKIREIRAHAQKTLGKLFDLKEFHWQTMKVGYVPLGILESSINHWIHTTSTAPNHQTSTTLTLCLLAYVIARVLNKD